MADRRRLRLRGARGSGSAPPSGTICCAHLRQNFAVSRFSAPHFGQINGMCCSRLFYRRHRVSRARWRSADWLAAALLQSVSPATAKRRFPARASRGAASNNAQPVATAPQGMCFDRACTRQNASESIVARAFRSSPAGTFEPEIRRWRGWFQRPPAASAAARPARARPGHRRGSTPAAGCRRPRRSGRPPRSSSHPAEACGCLAGG